MQDLSHWLCDVELRHKSSLDSYYISWCFTYSHFFGFLSMACAVDDSIFTFIQQSRDRRVS